MNMSIWCIYMYMQTHTCLHKNIVMDMAIDIGIFLPKLFPHIY